MRILRYLALASLGLLFGTTNSFADSVTLTLTGASNYVSPDGAYVAPYSLQASGTNQSLPVICDDYTVDVQLGDTWTAQTFTLQNLGTTGDSVRFLNSSNFGNTTFSNVAYEEAAWLTYQTGLFGGPPASNQQISDLNYAIWYLFDPKDPNLLADPGYSTRTNQISGLLSDAMGAVTGEAPLPDYFSRVIIYTPSCYGQTPCSAATAPPNSQEYITITSVPEPGSLALLATSGVLGLIVRRARRAP
jgi:PEP-CTERM motif